MGKADEERLAIGVQKYPCLYDKAVSAFHNKNEKKNAWEAVAKDIGYWILSTLSSITNKGRAQVFLFLNESEYQFDLGAMIIFLFGLFFRS